MVLKQTARSALCGYLAVLLLLPVPPTIYGSQESLGDLGTLQQDSRWLKATIEHLKLQRELTALQPFSGVTQKICQPGDGLGSLVLHMIYQTNYQYYATFSYNPHSQLTVRRGEQLLCGETVLQITLNGVILQKQGQRYRLSGQVATLLTATQDLTSSGLTDSGVGDAK